MVIFKVTQYSVRCDICGVIHDIDTCDGRYCYNDTPSRFFKREGWREIEGKTRCPECAKKAKEKKNEKN